MKSRGTFVPTTLELMLGDLNQFICESGFADSTQYGYGYNLRKLAEWLSTHALDFEHLTGTVYLQFLDDTHWGGNGRYAMFNAARSYIKWRYGVGHPFMHLRIRRPKPKPQRTLSVEQVEELLSSIDTGSEGGIRTLALVCLALDAGLRQVELCRADVRYLNLKKRRLEVEIKGGEWDTAVFSPYTASCLDSWLAIRARIINEVGGHTTALFISLQGKTRGEKVRQTSIKKVLERLSKRSQVKFSGHDLRRTFAVLSLKRGASTRLVQKAGRWKTLDMVEHYTAGLDAAEMAHYYPVQGIMDGSYSDMDDDSG